MQVSQKRHHLLVVKAPCKPRHQSPAHKDILPNRRVRCWDTARKRFAVKQAMQVRRHLLQRQVIFLVAMRTPRLVKVLPFRFLRGQRWR